MKDDAEEEAPWKIPLIRGKIETLIGHARLELGQLEEAYVCFQHALRYYGARFIVINHYSVSKSTKN